MSQDFFDYGEDNASEGVSETVSEASETAGFAGSEQPVPSLRPGFKSLCARIGVMMIVVFALRLISDCVLVLTRPYYMWWDEFQLTVLSFAVSIVAVNAVPITLSVFILKFPLKERIKSLYSKPRYPGRAVGMFPAMYGAAMVMHILTLLLAKLFAGTNVADSFNATQSMLTGDLPSAILRFVQAVIFAPIFEEFWFRGVALESLRPYGNGFAIFLTAILFGITHANLAQFFYATVIGIFLAYIAIHTGSIIVPMILHAMMNGISAITSLFLTDPDVSKYIRKASESNEMPPITSTSVRVYLAWNALVLLLMVVGIIMLIVKLVRIKRYKVPKVQTELSTGTRWGLLISRPTVIISLLFAADTMTVMFLTKKIIWFLFLIIYGVDLEELRA